jgi:hypothetical protein
VANRVDRPAAANQIKKKNKRTNLNEGNMDGSKRNLEALSGEFQRDCTD